MRRVNYLRVPDSSPAAGNCLRAALTLLLLLSLSPMLQAGTTWDGGGANDNWTTGANWNTTLTVPPQIPPPNNGTANIVMPAVTGLVQTPIVDVPYSINSLTFNSDGGNGRFVILAASELTIGSGGIHNNDADIQSVLGPVRLAASQIWDAGAGPLQMDAINLNSHILSLTGFQPIDLIGPIVGSGYLILPDNNESTVTISGASSNTFGAVLGYTQVRNGTLRLGKSGGATAVPGDLYIDSGGTVSLLADEQISQAAGNEVTVFSGGQLNIYDHTETLARLVLNGGSAFAASNGKLTAAEAIVAGATGYWLNYGSLYVGDTENGTLEISAGGYVSSAGGYIGNQSGVVGEVTVDGVGSTWGNAPASSIWVGFFGNGTLNITAGGAVSSGAGLLGHSGGSGTVSIDGMGSIWSNTAELIVGHFGAGTLDIRNAGSASSGLGVIGNQSGATGAATVQGMGSNWTIDDLLLVGNFVDGTLNVLSGGSVSNAEGRIGNGVGTDGEVTVDGMGSTWTNSGELSIGNSGSGTLNVTDGGNVSNSNAYIGNQAGATGAATVSGAGSTWAHSGFLAVGENGMGTLNVTMGGVVSNTHATIGQTGTGTVLVAGTGSTWTNSAFLEVANNGTGTLTIENGGAVSNTDGFIGRRAGSEGTVVVSGSNSTWHNYGNLHVGFASTSVGTLNVSNGGAVAVDADFEVGNGGTGIVTVSNGAQITTGNVSLALSGGTATLSVTDANSALVQSGAAIITVGHATDGAAALNVRNSAALTTGTGPINVHATGQINLESGAVFDARGPISINGGQFNFLGGALHVDTFNGNLLNQGGTLAPGHSVGATAVSGNYTQRPAAALEIEIGGVFPGDWDTLTVEGNASLDGTIEVVLVNVFEPVIGNSFTIITTNVGNVGGQFDTELFPIFNGLTFDVIYNPKSVVLQVIEATVLPGDFNADGIVDTADYVVWRKTDGTPAGYNTWRTHFGESIGNGSGGAPSDDAAVPERRSLVMLFTGTLLLAQLLRRTDAISPLTQCENLSVSVVSHDEGSRMPAIA